MIERELDLVVSRHAPGVCGFYFAGEIDKSEPWRELSDADKAAITPGLNFFNRHPHEVFPMVAALLDFLAEEETLESKWTRVHGTSTADLLVQRIALAAGLVRLAVATFHDGSTATFVRRA